MPDFCEIHLRSCITFKTEIGELLNEPRIRLLEAIDSEGSLSGASRALPMSYKAAWDAIRQMNRLAGCPLVTRTVGGRRGGSSMLTENGRRLVALYRSVEIECQSTLGALFGHLQRGGAPTSFRYLLRQAGEYRRHRPADPSAAKRSAREC